MADVTGVIFNIERYTIHDGPGIRTTVFLKGCPLSCIWCSNPESQSLKPQLAYFLEKCTGCGRCLTVCPQNAIIGKSGLPVEVDFAKCTGCGACVEYCYPEALVMMGRKVSAQEVVEVVLRDRRFYLKSGGGVTLSGGEPLMQAKFSAEILKRCKGHGIHTAIQTSGYSGKKEIDEVEPYTDLFIFDLKHPDSELHKSFTGRGNERVFENLKRLNEAGASIVIQIPLIPGYNDGDEHLSHIYSFVKGLRSVQGVNLLAYHSLGAGKYRRLGRDYQLQDLVPPTKDYLENKKRQAVEAGIHLVSFNG